MAEKRKYATYEIDEELLAECSFKYIVGVDEVGRGPGAGPVTAAAVWIPRDNLGRLMTKVKDSKSLSENRRDELFELIASTCLWAHASVDNNVVDVFEDMGLEVDLIDEEDLRGVDFSDYKFIFVGEGRLRNLKHISFDDVPGVITNGNYVKQFGFLDKGRVSKLASNSKLKIKKISH